MTPAYQSDRRETRAEEARTPILRGRELAGYTQEAMAEYLRIDPRTLRRYENGELPTPDSVMLDVAELAGRPALVAAHFKGKYQIPDEIIPPVRTVPLEVAVIHLLRELERLEKHSVASKLLELADDGVIDPAEETDYRMIMDKLDGVKTAVELLRYHT